MTDYEWIDDGFRVEQKKWGTWDSFDQNGKCIITALTEEECVRATRFYLKGMQEGFEGTKSYSGSVNGKL